MGGNRKVLEMGQDIVKKKGISIFRQGLKTTLTE